MAEMKNKMKKRFLTLYWVDINESNKGILFKDVGSIPLAMSKYLNYESNFAYLSTNENFKSNVYEKYVNLIEIKNNTNKLIKYFNIIKFILKKIRYYDVLNLYAVGGGSYLLISLIAKLVNPKLKIFVKMDLGRETFNNLIETEQKIFGKFKGYILQLLGTKIDFYTVETKAYVNALNKLIKFNGKVKYLPNGFFSDVVKFDKDIKKEKIILTVGRLGTIQKNTEIFVEAIENIETEKLKNWKFYLVGSMTEEFTEWFNNKLKLKPYLKNYFVVTGNISDKKELYTLYAKSMVFVLPSRWESWGLVLTEATAFSCYPIVTDCCDAFYEMLDITNSNFAEIIHSEDKDALKTAIEEVLDSRIDYINKGKDASNFVKENFSWRIIANKLEIYFNECYEK